MYPVTGRAAAAVIPYFSRPARKEGLGSTLSSYSRLAVWAGIAFALILCVVSSVIFQTGQVGQAGQTGLVGGLQV